MKCPIDDVDLQMTERQGIEIDYCPKCRGVWLDRGELDKIIERSVASEAPPRSAEKPAFQERPGYQEQRYHDDRHEHRPKKRKESFLGDLFDF
jgi:Zn-finger nucleic acid-binding protein